MLFSPYACKTCHRISQWFVCIVYSLCFGLLIFWIWKLKRDETWWKVMKHINFRMMNLLDSWDSLNFLEFSWYLESGANMSWGRGPCWRDSKPSANHHHSGPGPDWARNRLNLKGVKPRSLQIWKPESGKCNKMQQSATNIMDINRL